MKDYYKILQLDFGSSYEDVEESYNKLCEQYESDTDIIADINEAYETLINSEVRDNYDIIYTQLFKVSKFDKQLLFEKIKLKRQMLDMLEPPKSDSEIKLNFIVLGVHLLLSFVPLWILNLLINTVIQWLSGMSTGNEFKMFGLVVVPGILICAGIGYVTGSLLGKIRHSYKAFERFVLNWISVIYFVYKMFWVVFKLDFSTTHHWILSIIYTILVICVWIVFTFTIAQRKGDDELFT